MLREERGTALAILGGGLAVLGIGAALWAWAQVMFLAVSGAYDGVMVVYGRCWETHSTNAPESVIESCVQRESELWPFASASDEVVLTIGGIAAATAGILLLVRFRPGLVRALDGSVTWRFVAALVASNMLIWLWISSPSERPPSGGTVVVLLHGALLGIALWRWHSAWRREGSVSPWRGLLLKIVFYPSLYLSFLGLTIAFIVTVGGSLGNGLAFLQEMGAFFLTAVTITAISGILLMRTATRRAERLSPASRSAPS